MTNWTRRPVPTFTAESLDLMSRQQLWQKAMDLRDQLGLSSSVIVPFRHADLVKWLLEYEAIGRQRRVGPGFAEATPLEFQTLDPDSVQTPRLPDRTVSVAFKDDTTRDGADSRSSKPLIPEAHHSPGLSSAIQPPAPELLPESGEASRSSKVASLASCTPRSDVNRLSKDSRTSSVVSHDARVINFPVRPSRSSSIASHTPRPEVEDRRRHSRSSSVASYPLAQTPCKSSRASSVSSFSSRRSEVFDGRKASSDFHGTPRAAVSAESPGGMRMQTGTLSKGASQRRLLSDAIRASQFLGAAYMTTSHINTLVDAFRCLKVTGAKATVIKEGTLVQDDEPGLFVLERGRPGCSLMLGGHDTMEWINPGHSLAILHLNRCSLPRKTNTSSLTSRITNNRF